MPPAINLAGHLNTNSPDEWLAMRAAERLRLHLEQLGVRRVAYGVGANDKGKLRLAIRLQDPTRDDTARVPKTWAHDGMLYDVDTAWVSYVAARSVGGLSEDEAAYKAADQRQQPKNEAFIRTLGFEPERRLGKPGSYGEAWLLQDGRVIKLTHSSAEEMCVEQMQNLQRTGQTSVHLPLIESIGVIRDDDGPAMIMFDLPDPRPIPFTFWYVREYLNDTYEDDTFEVFEDAAADVYAKTGLILQDIAGHNWGRREQGRHELVFRDLACRTWSRGYHSSEQNEEASQMNAAPAWLLVGSKYRITFDPLTKALHLKLLAEQTGWPLVQYVDQGITHTRTQRLVMGVLRPDGWFFPQLNRPERIPGWVTSIQRVPLNALEEEIKGALAQASETLGGPDFDYAAKRYAQFSPVALKLDPHAPPLHPMLAEMLGLPATNSVNGQPPESTPPAPELIVDTRSWHISVRVDKDNYASALHGDTAYIRGLVTGVVGAGGGVDLSGLKPMLAQAKHPAFGTYIGVQPKYRRSDLARKIAERLESELVAQGTDLFFLYAASSENRQAVLEGWYRMLGFQLVPNTENWFYRWLTPPAVQPVNGPPYAIVPAQRTVITPARLIESLCPHDIPEDPAWPSPTTQQECFRLLHRLAWQQQVRCLVVAHQLILEELSAVVSGDWLAVQRQNLQCRIEWFAEQSRIHGERRQDYDIQVLSRYMPLEDMPRASAEAYVQGIEHVAARFGRATAEVTNRPLLIAFLPGGGAPQFRVANNSALAIDRLALASAKLRVPPPEPAGGRASPAQVSTAAVAAQTALIRSAVSDFYRRWWQRCRCLLAFADAPRNVVSGPPENPHQRPPIQRHIHRTGRLADLERRAAALPDDPEWPAPLPTPVALEALLRRLPPTTHPILWASAGEFVLDLVNHNILGSGLPDALYTFEQQGKLVALASELLDTLVRYPTRPQADWVDNFGNRQVDEWFAWLEAAADSAEAGEPPNPAADEWLTYFYSLASLKWTTPVVDNYYPAAIGPIARMLSIRSRDSYMDLLVRWWKVVRLRLAFVDAPVAELSGPPAYNHTPVRRTVITPAALAERLHPHDIPEDPEWPTPNSPSDVARLLSRLAQKPAFLCGIVAVEMALPHWQAWAPPNLTPAQRIAPDHALRLAKHWFRTPPPERWGLFEMSLTETERDLQVLTQARPGRHEAAVHVADFAVLSALYLLRAIQRDLNGGLYGDDYRAMLTVAIDSSIRADVWAADSFHPGDPSRQPRYGERWWRRCRASLAFADAGEAEVSGPPRDLGPAEHIHAGEGSTQIPNTWLPKPRTPIFAPQIEGFVYLGEHTFSHLNDEEGLKTFAVPVYRNIRFAQAAGVRLDAPIQDRPNARILTADTEFVLLPLGHHSSFLMGSPWWDKQARPYEKPQHEVQFKQRFLMARTPVTQRVWAKLAGGLEPYPSYFGAVDASDSNDPGAERPVEQVLWVECVQWCELNDLRLPTEAEWEFACRAGTKTRYLFGNQPNRLVDFAWYLENAGAMTHPVATLATSAFGLFDILGNVWEWCEDEWGDNYKGAAADGSVHVYTGPSYRVDRGGSWNQDEAACRSAYRYGHDPLNRGNNLGFRPALTVHAPKS